MKPQGTPDSQNDLKKQAQSGASVVVQWLGIFLPWQGIQVQSLVQKVSTGLGATKLMSHNC